MGNFLDSLMFGQMPTRPDSVAMVELSPTVLTAGPLALPTAIAEVVVVPSSAGPTRPPAMEIIGT
jgi:hypothetical protein